FLRLTSNGRKLSSLGRMSYGKGFPNVWVQLSAKLFTENVDKFVGRIPSTSRKRKAMSQYEIGVVVGSLREGSCNRRLARGLQKLAPEELRFTRLEIGDLPLYNQDDDAHQADAVKRLKNQILSSDALLFITPEYNRSMPGVLKNAIDHAPRPCGQGAGAAKPAAVVGASMGAMGTAVAQQHVRTVLAYFDMRVMGQPEVYLHASGETFDGDGGFAQASTRQFLQGW